MTLAGVERELARIARRKIDTGALTVKLLAAKSGYTAAHASNFKDNRRNTSVAALDAFMLALGFEVQLMPRQAGAPARAPGSASVEARPR